MFALPLRYTDCTFGYRSGVRVLDRLFLELPEGCTVVLGPNGAGKSTLLSLGASLLAPKRGRVALGELDSSRRRTRGEYRRRVGWLPQQIRPVPGITVREQAAYAGWLKGLSKAEAWRRSAQALERVRLSDLADRRSHELSGGQTRRLGIAQALVHDAEVVLLDEPTAGLDPVQRGVFRDLLGELADHVSFVVSTHQTEDLLDVYQTVVVLDRGQATYRGATEDFLSLAGADVPAERKAETAYRGLVRGEA
ncbi:ATP-binding cassette domain-containing protein [Streptomyces sp. TRM 70351]|uniref:ATP-binding cassette domain-containing protein n=1 Tax=Streptomyces sp. TRM 70351 TaxID=3116552 RepID=UPI002E7ACAD9|nr:ATP-binding cassette domain-containing protein [Streptomyces sp. TRM 70351]MEE1929682.1 ATP-binding cassette domain-containing protein [Streptomyces sp. TRM 70351]